MKFTKLRNHSKNSFKKTFLVSTLGLIISSSTFGLTPRPPTSIDVPTRGLMNPVKVMYPETSVPSIKASSIADMSYMYGYLHAKDRLFQMDYTRRLANGTVAELVGAAGIPTDIQLRTIGFKRAALRSYQASSTQTKEILQSYANGVNAWLAENDLPVEYSGLEITKVKPWRPVDSLSIVKLIAFQLSNDLQELDWTVAIGTMQQVGAAAGFDGTALFLEDLYRSGPPDDRITLPGFLESIGGIVLASDEPDAPNKSASVDLSNFTQYSKKDIDMVKGLLSIWESSADLNKLKDDSARDVGSNVWAVTGDRTVSGHPMVANDPHLSLDYPSVFYPVHLYAAKDGVVEFNAAGVGFPGAPAMAQGCNERLCWGSTVNPVDETDFYFEDIRTNLFGLPAFTVFEGKEEPIKYIFQVYYANQIGDGIADNLENQKIGYDAGGITYIIKRRNNGPILSVDRANNRAVSMQYTGFSATQEAEAFFDMATARDVYEFGEATTKFDVGSQNFGVADIDGNIAYFTGAEVPIREDLQTMNTVDGVPPMFIRDGTGARKNEWMPVSNPQANQAVPHEIIPTAEMPFVINPSKGWFANANNDPIGTSLDNNTLNQVRPGGGLYYISQGGYSTYRMGRIDRLLTEALAGGDKVDMMDMKTFQANTQSMDAELIIPHIFNAFNNAASDDAWPGIQQFLADPRLVATLENFGSWDYSMPTGIAKGYDFGDNPFALAEPSQTEINNSVAATIYSTWRSMVIQNTIDATMKGVDAAIGQDLLAPQLPGSKRAFNAFKHLLDNFDNAQGVGASGINFFTNPQAPTPEDARDFVILASLKQALDLLASDEFKAAFNNSTDIMDYRWGKLHRITFAHPLGASLSVPNGLFGLSTTEGLSGVARQGGYQVLDASGHSVRAKTINGFMFSDGPARRFVGLMTPEGPVIDQMIPGGQSGVITSGSLYVNQLFSWLVNSYLPLFVDIDLVEQIKVFTYNYLPE